MQQIPVKVTLVRHGQPTVSLGEWVSGRSLRAFIDRYNAAGITPTSDPPPVTLALITDASWVLTSDYRRTIESAQRLGLMIHASEVQFREVDCWRDFPGWVMPGWGWVLLTRVLWPMEKISAPESFPQALDRAQEGAIALAQLAHIHDHIVLVGHGGLNTLIARALVAMGWQGPTQPKLSHWSATTYTFHAQ